MSATVILTTPDPDLLAVWSQIVSAFTLLPDDELARELKRPGARVWIKDLNAPQVGFGTHPDTVVIAVGEPLSLPFFESKKDPRVAFRLSYVESRLLLRQVEDACRELTEGRAVISMLSSRPTARASPAPVLAPPPRSLANLDFIEASVDHLTEQVVILDAWRRGLRGHLCASRVAVFLRQGSEFRADSEGWSCPSADMLVDLLQGHAAIVNSDTFEDSALPLTQVMVRQRLAAWNARLLIPIDDRGTLAGWVCFGPRSDARAYSQSDNEDALVLVRMLGNILRQGRAFRQAQDANAAALLLASRGPKYRLVRQGEAPTEEMEAEAREVLARARCEGRRVEREIGTARVTAAPLGCTGDYWVLLDPEGATLKAQTRKLESERFGILRDLGLILSHEMSNALMSFSTYFQHQKDRQPATAEESKLVRQVEIEMGRLKSMPHLLDDLYEMTKRSPTSVDLRRLVTQVAREVGGIADVSDAVMTLTGHEDNLRRALAGLCREILEQSSESAPPKGRIQIRLQERGQGPTKTHLVFVAFQGLRLDQIKSGAAESVGEFPTTEVYLAREIIRYHGGTVHVAQGAGGPELYVSLNSLPDAVAMPASPVNAVADKVQPSIRT